MNIFTSAFIPPSGLVTHSFCFFPTNLNFYQSDFEAVMRSRDILRVWSQSDWPQDGFTAAENREDLKLHMIDNENHTAYGYMIYSSDKTDCYGSLYVNPLTSIPGNYQVSEDQLSSLNNFQARIDYWVIEEDSDLEESITQEIRRWMTSEWKIRPLFTARHGMHKRIGIYQKLQFSCMMELKGHGTNLILYESIKT